ncbi:hypothetical protein Q0M94_12135 [Deinococcus radiomollis]|uniref:hypothetical protein n=1 Tax=Deinococcus radiomollis TaxID=468916 RepID=UPI003892B9F2
MPEHNRIKELLAERKESQEAFSQRIGIGSKTLWNAISGRPTNRSTRLLICHGFGLPEDQVFSAADDYYASNTEAQIPA